MLVKSKDHMEFTEYALEAHQKINLSGIPNVQGCRIPVLSTWNIELLRSLLHDYKDKWIVDYLQFGFPVNFKGRRHEGGGSRGHKNHKGARENMTDVDRYVVTEIEHKSALGPFTSNPFSLQPRFSPINTRDKKDSTEKRVIVDLSFPEGESVNDEIEMENYFGHDMSFKLPNVDSLVQHIVELGRGALLFKRDIRRCYRQIPVDYGDAHLLGYIHRNHMYFDVSLPMGLSSSAFICQSVTRSLRYVAIGMGIRTEVYLDDFLGVSKPEQALDQFDALGRLIGDSGAEESTHKAIAPTVKMPCIGLDFDTVEFSITVPEDKLEEIIALTSEWSKKSVMIRRELESLIGKLNFVAQCVRAGRLFITRLLDQLRTMNRSTTYAITEETRKDIQWWNKFIRKFNGKSFLPFEPVTRPDEIIACDACLVACGGWSEGEYFSEPFPQETMDLNLHISALELLTVKVAVEVWLHKIKGRRILIRSDNMAVVTALNLGRTRDTFMNSCLRDITFLCATQEFEVRCSYISTRDNTLPDLLSRAYNSQVARDEFTRRTEDQVTERIVVPLKSFQLSNVW